MIHDFLGTYASLGAQRILSIAIVKTTSCGRVLIPRPPAETSQVPQSYGVALTIARFIERERASPGSLPLDEVEVPPCRGWAELTAGAC